MTTGAYSTPTAMRPTTPQLAIAGGIGAALLVGVAARYGADRDVFLALFVTAVLVVVSLEDLRRRVIPNRVVVPAWAIALVVNTTLHPARWWAWLVASLGTAFLFFVFAQLSNGGIGMGDVKLVGFIGAALGGAVIPALIVGTAVSALTAAGIIVRHGPEARKRTMPLGPFLAFGAIVVLLFF
jgi:prepilin signal peptidase PulO-like enzyme (type II secretory pathway)